MDLLVVQYCHIQGTPVPPERINSDPSYRRGPLPLTREQIEKGGHEVETIQKYNQQLVECLEEGRPALPPKKKHSECARTCACMDICTLLPSP